MSNNFKIRLLISILFSPIIISLIYLGDWYFIFLLLIVLVLGLFEIYKIKELKIKFIIIIFFIFFIFCSYKINNSNDGEKIFLLLLIITWLSDSGGYLFGKIIGGKKINFISPNKTYIGFFGSIAFSQLAIIYQNYIDIFFYKNLFINSFTLILFSLTVILGDLFFSFLKRKSKIKDYSKLIPGHGGLFDRIDGLIFIVIAYYIFENIL
ncbi:MAG: phosphatidate cytidylyltransferase [Pelagibacteraceae bacterium]